MKHRIVLCILSILVINISCTKPPKQEAIMYSNDLKRIIDDIEGSFANLDKRIDQLSKASDVDSLLKESINEIELIEAKISTARTYLEKKEGFNGDTLPNKRTAKLIDSTKHLLSYYKTYFTESHELLSQMKAKTITNENQIVINENLMKINKNMISALENYNTEIKNYNHFISDWVTKFK